MDSAQALILIATTFSGSVVLAQSSHPPQVVSVCDVLKSIEQLNGKTVTLRAVVGWIGHHGVQAISQDGLDPYVHSCPGIQRNKRSWPPALAITSPSKLEPDERAVVFREQAPSLSDLAVALRERERITGKDVAIATITGEIRTRAGLKIRHHGDDIFGNGYGQTGALPGLLIVKTIVAVEDPETHVPLRIDGKSF